MNSSEPLATIQASSEVLNHYQTQYQAGIHSGEFEPFVWPHRALAPYILICYLLLPPTSSRAIHLLRYPLFILIIYLSGISSLECRSPAVTVGYGIGLLNAWTVLWSATLLIFNDARTDLKRIERQETATNNDIDALSAPEDVTPVKTIEGETTALEGTSSTGLTLLHPVGEIAPLPPSSSADSSTPKPDSLEIFASQDDPIPATLPQTFVWQPLPSTFLHRADWVLDLICNFRGLRWTHQLPTGTFPPPPPEAHP